jgi:putative membrane protein
MRSATGSHASRTWRKMSEPRHLHPAAVAILGIRFGRQLVLPLLLPVIVNIVQRGFRVMDPQVFILTTIMVLALLGLSSTWAVAFWRRYAYRVEDNELRIEQGIISRKRTFVPRDRIQAIDLVEGVLHRIFGVVAVRVQTASSEVSLLAISRESADELRRALTQERESIPVTDSVDDEQAEPATAPAATRHLPATRLLVAAATSGGIGIALPIIFSGMSILNNALRDVDLYDAIAEVAGAAPFVTVAAAVLALAWLLSIAGTVLAHAGFTIRRVQDNLLIERGLIERRRATVPLNRIQAVRIVEGTLRQPFGYAMLRVESAGYGREAGESTVLFPFLRRDEVPGFLRELVPEFAFEPELQPLPRRALRRYITRMLLMGLGISALVILLFYPAGLASLSLVPLAGVLGWLRYRDAGWAIVGGYAVLRYRNLARSTVIVPRFRIQSSDVAASWFQRRADLATLRVSVASGSRGATFSLMHLERAVAESLFAWRAHSPRSTRSTAS